jgi:hypothetical protein
VQDYPRGGNPLGQLLGGTLFIAATVAFGLFVGSFFRTRERAFQYIIATSIPLFFLANLSWPAVMTPQPLVWLAQLLPTTSGINLMVRLNQMDARLAEVSHELITLTVLLLLYGSLATWRLLAKKGRRGLSRKRPVGRLRLNPLRPLFLHEERRRGPAFEYCDVEGENGGRRRSISDRRVRSGARPRGRRSSAGCCPGSGGPPHHRQRHRPR